MHIRVAFPSEIESLHGQIVQVYRHAFGPPPYAKSQSEVEAFARFLPLHATAVGFRLVVATNDERNRLLGFAYGRTPCPGQPWHDFIVELLRTVNQEEWLDEAYQLAEMAVLPQLQGQGIGHALHDHLLQDLPYKRAVLTTMADDTPAYHFYLNRGWRVLMESFVVPDLPRPYRVMGLSLKPV